LTLGDILERVKWPGGEERWDLGVSDVSGRRPPRGYGEGKLVVRNGYYTSHNSSRRIGQKRGGLDKTLVERRGGASIYYGTKEGGGAVKGKRGYSRVPRRKKKDSATKACSTVSGKREEKKNPRPFL